MGNQRSLAFGIAMALSFILATAFEVYANGAIALTGQVSSQKEKIMEGVIVGAKKDGSTMTVDPHGNLLITTANGGS